ncbi:MAG: VanZ family protein, partial [Candidatus Omnitrophica bacterium]|nr:VanZ family protein [Candidatus Omnitrophota bacterium]
MKFFKYWLPVLIWCTLIFFLSGTPNLSTGLGAWDAILRKAAHIIEYLILTFLFYRAFKGSFSLVPFYSLIWPF